MGTSVFELQIRLNSPFTKEIAFNCSFRIECANRQFKNLLFDFIFQINLLLLVAIDASISYI